MTNTSYRLNNPGMPEAMMSAREVVRHRMASILEDIKAHSYEADRVGGEYCKSVVLRNEVFRRSAPRHDDDAGFVRFATEEFPQHDYRIKTDIDHLAGLFLLVAKSIMDLDPLLEKVESEPRSNDGRRAANLQAELDAVKARMKAHATHNQNVREQVWAITDGKCFY